MVFQWIDHKFHPRGKSTFLPERFHFDEQDNLRKPRDLKKRKESKRYSSPENEDSPKRKKSKVYTDWDLDQIRGRSTSLTLLKGKDCKVKHSKWIIVFWIDLFAFNTLSQNIVSLGVKPEIEVGRIEEIIGIVP